MNMFFNIIGCCTGAERKDVDKKNDIFGYER